MKDENGSWAKLEKYAAANAALPPPDTVNKRVVFMGDSITEFWEQADSAFFTLNQYINRGISSQVTEMMLVRFRQDVLALRPAVVVILGGTNDIAENNGPATPQTAFDNIVSMAELAAAKGIAVVLCSVLPAEDFYWHRHLLPVEKIKTLNKLLHQYAIDNHLQYVDYYSLLTDADNSFDKKYSNDGVHPNSAGYAVMKPLVEKAIAHTLNNGVTL
ncbi:MAG TPA: SGNH/GDSL hydrolase family protein [Ferruginibacter sp.]|nr:SGNH/GDSL hydrolase family protein [Ferruginibacter sp.]